MTENDFAIFAFLTWTLTIQSSACSRIIEGPPRNILVFTSSTSLPKQFWCIPWTDKLTEPQTDPRL